MIYPGSILKVSDNSGALTVRCIKVYGHGKFKSGKVGDIILVSVRSYISFNRQKSKLNIKKKVKKSQVYKAILVRTKKEVIRKQENVKFCDNAVVLFKSENSLLFTSTFGPVCKELREKGQIKILLLAGNII